MKTDSWTIPPTIAPNNFVYKSLSNWSLNFAVGCSHSCRFCTSGETKITMADRSVKLMVDIKVGDQVLGLDKTHELVPSRVIAKVATERAAFRIKTNIVRARNEITETAVVCSSDHRWLTTDGWKSTAHDRDNDDDCTLRVGDTLFAVNPQNGRLGKVTLLAIDDMVIWIDMFDITTSTENFIANGLVAHNCYVPDTISGMAPKLEKDFGVSDPDADWGDYVFLRKLDEKKFCQSLANAERRKELKADGNRAVILCSTTDAYQALRQPWLDELRATRRYCLEQILNRSTINVRILTRSPLAREDFDLMKAFGHRLLFGMSLPTLRNDIAKIYEPKAPSPSQRLETLRAAKAAGLNVFVAVAPTYPECDGTDLLNTLMAVRDLDPVTVFHEPINIRAENVARIEKHAADLGVTVKTEVFKTPETWRRYAFSQLRTVEGLAKKIGLTQLHLWPDQSLGYNVSVKQFKDEPILPWLNKWWSRVSEWPKAPRAKSALQDRIIEVNL